MAGIGALAFLGALAFTVSSASTAGQERWYRGRAVAESVKTLAWSYAVGGDPFPRAGAEADQRFLERIEALVRSVGSVELVATTGPQITPEMAELRQRPLAERRETYRRARIAEQAEWYRAKAAANRAAGRRWLALAVAANAVGLAGAIGRFVDLYDADVLGVAAAVAGAAIAWSQLRQHRNLATAYALAAQELGVVGDRLRDPTTEEDWVEAVADAEAAISREHTMWLARRGHDAP